MTTMPPKLDDSDQATGATRTRKIVAHTLAVLGVVLVLLGLVHFVGLPLVLEANKNGATNLPSIEDTGVGYRLFREPVFYGLLSVGVDRCLFGVILLLCVPELKKGRSIVWRICMVIGLAMLLGYTPLIWTTFERLHLPPLVMPAIGLLIVVPLLLGRHSFTVGTPGPGEPSEISR